VSIERTTGLALQAGAVIYGMAGGGWSGITPELDDVVLRAAEALAAAYGQDIEIRFNSDCESGGAWLKTPDGFSAHVGIRAELVTARKRGVWQTYADRYAREVETGLSPYDGEPLTADQLNGARESMESYLGSLARCPEGQLTVYAHITARAAGERTPDLARLDRWYKGGQASAYHQGAAESVSDALARCLRFAPREDAR
jgi:hypothetical protein